MSKMVTQSNLANPFSLFKKTKLLSPAIWEVYPNQSAISKKIAESLQCSALIAQLMLNRSVTSINEAESFLNDEWDHWPQLPNQDLFVTHLKKLIETKRAICVYGDYDADGVTSTAMMVGLLKKTGCTVDYISPHRFNDGYGLNMNRIREVINKKYAGLITLDCGISNINEINTLKEESPDTVVLIMDHHKCPDTLPNADAIINPQLADKTHPAYNLCSAALVDYVFRTTPSLQIDPSPYIDLAAIGLIADVMPLTNLHRWYVKKGLEAIQTQPRQTILNFVFQQK